MLELYDHQKEAVEKLGSGKVLVGGVGSGKSLTALHYYWKYETSRMKHPKPLYVITTARKRDSGDWQMEAIPYGLYPNDPESKAPYVVDSWNNIKKYEGVTNAFFIFDEQRVVGSGTWVKTFIKIAKGNRWILLSATPGDTWSDYIPIFIANGFYRNRTEFLSRHVVFSRYTKYPQVERYIDVPTLIQHKNRVLVYMPFVRYTSRHVQIKMLEYDKHMFYQVFRDRWNVFKHTPIMQAGEWCYTLRRVVNEDRRKLEAVLDIFEEKKRVIIFYNFDYELEVLRDGLSEYLYTRTNVKISEYNGHIHEELPNTDEWVYLVQYTAASEAWNCITTDTIIFYSLNYSYKVMEQAAGRIDRLDTRFQDLYYYILATDSPIDKSILRALKNKQNFNENKYFRKEVGE